MDEHIAIALGDAARLMRRRFDERARAIGVTRTQWLALKILSRQEGINQGKLAEFLEVEPITCCRMVDRLEESGLVERRRDPNDRRAWQIFLTDKAHSMAGQLRVIGNSVCDHALEGLSAEKRAQLYDILLTIHANLTNDTQFQENEAAHG